GAELLLDLRRGPVRDHGAQMLERASERHGGRDREHRRPQRAERRPLEDEREQPAERDEAADADPGGQEPDRHRGRDAAASTLHQAPEPPVEIHPISREETSSAAESARATWAPPPRSRPRRR